MDLPIPVQVENVTPTLNEKMFPIQNVWIVKLSIIIIIVAIILLFNKEYIDFIFLFIFALFNYLLVKLAVVRFHFSLDEHFITIKQGILSKTQRQLPYTVVQNVIVEQGFLDRLFGISTLNFENASEAGGLKINKGKKRKRWQFQNIGIIGNQVNIPGLKKEQAELLKNKLLEKIQRNQGTELGL